MSTTFVMLTRLDSQAIRAPDALEMLEREMMRHVRQDCPDVEWIGSYAALGPYDYIDIFKADDIDVATKISALVRSYGHAHTEIWPVTEWARFKQLMHSLPGGIMVAS